MLKQDNPLMTMLTKIGNMMIVNFYFLLTCLPIVTILPACAALFHTMTKTVRTSGEGVTRDYFASFRDALNPGIFLSLMTVGSGLLLFTCVDFGWQMMHKTLLGTAYFAVGCILSVTWVMTVFYLAPALSRFEGNAFAILRIAFFLPSRNLLGTVLMAVLFAAMAFLTDFYPVVLLLLPAMYTDLVCGSVEKALKKFMNAAQVQTDLEVDIKQKESAANESIEKPVDEISALEQAKLMDVLENAAKTGEQGNENGGA